MSGEMDEIVREFLVESYENLDKLDRELMQLERDSSDKECLHSIFRTLHSIKGACGFLGFAKLEHVAHAGENLLDRLRNGELEYKPVMASALLTTVDVVRAMLVSIENTGNEGIRDDSALVKHLHELEKGDAVAHGEASTHPRSVRRSKGKKTSEEKDTSQALNAIPAIPASLGKSNSEAKFSADDSTYSANVFSLGNILVEQGGADLEAVRNALDVQDQGDMRKLGEILMESGLAEPMAVASALQTQMESRSNSLSESSIRVDIGLLDKLMNLTGELVLSRNQILQFTQNMQDPAFVAASQRLNLITTELQEGIMKTRMQPIGGIWAKFPRVVRDLALMLNKQVGIEMEGKETELDRTIIEAIKDPLTHIVRNSVDHGIELPEQRIKAGKKPEGTLSLRAFHEGGQVNIEISDDGAGLDPERIKAKALSKGLVTAQQVGSMSPKEILNLVFLPGFSTAEAITNISGRGVGMDVVRNNIEKIGGTVDIHSTVGKGSTIKIKIPLTLAIIPALVVECKEHRYAIPQISLLELVRLEGDAARHGVEHIHGSPVYRLRGELLPLVFLQSELWQLPEQRFEEMTDPVVNIVILQADGHVFGLVVNGVQDTVEIVVKPLSKHLKGISCFAGATILGDGKVGLILDVMGIAQKAHVFSGVRERVRSEQVLQDHEDSDLETLLLCRSPDDGRLAIPLSLVARLEEFPRSTLERVGEQDVVQYRGQILPLITVHDVLPERRVRYRRGEDELEEDNLQVVVHNHHNKSIGLVVDRILDITRENLDLQRPASRAGVRGCLVIQEKVTELLDLHAVIRAGNPTFFATEER